MIHSHAHLTVSRPFRWNTQKEDAAKALLVWHDLCKDLCSLDSSLSIAYAFEEFATKKKELVSHVYYTALDVLKQDKESSVRLVGLKASVDAALNKLKFEGEVYTPT